MTKTHEEEMSIEDFLGTADGDTEIVVNSVNTVPVVPEIKAIPENGFLDELKTKFDELDAERERLDAEIDRLRARCAWIGKAQDALAMTMSLFEAKGE